MMSRANESESFERTEPYLRPQQVEEFQEEHNRLKSMLEAPSHISGRIEDRPGMMRQIAHVSEQLHKNKPEPYAEDQIDRAAHRERELMEDILTGMPTQAEMRRNPPGATDKHRAWERRNKKKIQEWKNIRLRRHAGGQIDAPADATDVANLERFRPAGGTMELNMDNAQIPGQQFFFPSGQIPVTNVMSDEDRARIKSEVRAAQEDSGVVVPNLE